MLRFTAFSCLSLVFIPASFAQVTAEQAPDVVISATRTPTPANEVASSVTVITSEQIDQRQPQSVLDLLRDVPGVTVAQNGALGQTAQVYLRGTHVGHTLVLVDGLQINDPSDPSGAYDFAYLTPDNIERIEVLRGPQSTLYGSQAIGGVINIITKRGQGKPHVYADAFYGSYNLRKTSIGSSGSVERFSYTLETSHLQSDGISAHPKRFGGVESDPYRNNMLTGSARAALTENLNVGVSARAHNASTQFDDFGSDTEELSLSHQYDLHAFGDLTLLDGSWKQEFALSNLNLKRNYYTSFGPYYYSGNRIQGDWNHHFQLPHGHLLTAGYTVSQDSARSDSFAGTIPDLTNHGIFLQDQFDIAEQLYVSVGARMDYFSNVDRAFTWRIAPAYLIRKTGTKLKATYGTGFRAPSLYQLYSFFGDPNLDPERSRGADAGFEQNLWGDQVTFGSTAFWNDIDNLIDFNFATNTYFNVNRARTRGVESMITWRPDVHWTLSLSHTYLQTRDATTRDDLYRRPKHTYGAQLNYTYSKGDAGISFNGVGSRDDIGFSFSRIENKPYRLLGAYASYQLTDYAKLYSRLDNILNERYMAVYGYANPGFTAYGGVKLTY